MSADLDREIRRTEARVRDREIRLVALQTRALLRDELTIAMLRSEQATPQQRRADECALTAELTRLADIAEARTDLSSNLKIGEP